MSGLQAVNFVLVDAGETTDLASVMPVKGGSAMSKNCWSASWDVIVVTTVLKDSPILRCIKSSQIQLMLEDSSQKLVEP